MVASAGAGAEAGTAARDRGEPMCFSLNTLRAHWHAAYDAVGRVVSAGTKAACPSRAGKQADEEGGFGQTAGAPSGGKKKGAPGGDLCVVSTDAAGGRRGSDGASGELPLGKPSRRSTDGEEGTDPHDYMRHGDVGHRRRSVEVIAKHLKWIERVSTLDMTAGPPVTRLNARRNLLVVRGPGWRWGEDDGGAGQVGMVLNLNETTGTLAVHWQKSGLTRDCYKLDGEEHLCVAPVHSDLEQAVGRQSSGTSSSSSSRSGLEDDSEDEKAQGTAEDEVGPRASRPSSLARTNTNNSSGTMSRTSSAVGGSLSRTNSVERTPKSAGTRRSASGLSGLPRSPSAGARGHGPRRNSQGGFSSKAQTVIILDWDDTLFPSSYIRGDIRLPLRMPLESQNISAGLRAKVTAHLEEVATRAEQLLRLAWQLSGKVIVVTLARSPWVTEASVFFFPKVAELIKELGIKVVYASGADGQRPVPPPRLTDEQLEEFWGNVKGEAIAKEVRDFYTQYEGQSWKNIISIGDSEFERLGTMRAVEEYMRRQGIADVKVGSNRARQQEAQEPPSPKVEGVKAHQAEIKGHFYRVRIKTFKMLDQPTGGELVAQLDMLRQWLPLMVNLDDGFDVEFGGIQDMGHIQMIDDVLRGGTVDQEGSPRPIIETPGEE